MDILTVKEAEEWLEIEAGGGGFELEQMISNVSLRIARATGRIDFGPSEERTEYHDGGSRMIALNYWPITSVASIYDDSDHLWASDSLVDSTEYYVSSSNSDPGVVFMESGAFVNGFKSVKVTYTGGWNQADIPAPIKAACRLQIEDEWTKRKSGRFSGDGTASRGLLPEVMSLISTYTRKVPVA